MKIEEGYWPGIIGDITSLHATYYHEASGFGSAFESLVAGGLAEFITRLDRPQNQIWSIRDKSKTIASIVIDGEDIGDKIAHLRWFIVSNVLRGSGAGNQLLNKALEFCGGKEFDYCDLWTFSDLTAARHLYEKNGFVLVEEAEGDQWGKMVTEQKFRKDLRR